jgi:hypothetical protein
MHALQTPSFVAVYSLTTACSSIVTMETSRRTYSFNGNIEKVFKFCDKTIP